MKKTNAFNISVSALFVAVSVLICFIASLFPTMSLSITAVTGIATSIVLIECGYKYSILLYIASSVIALILVPEKQCVLFYMLLFGHYPIIRGLFHKLKNTVLIWGMKLVVESFLYFLVYVLSIYVLGVEEVVGWSNYFLSVALLLPVFVFYDICLGKIMHLYVLKHIFR